MELLKVIVFDLLSSAPILVGIIALTGLILQKESVDKVISGTLKTIVGFLVFGVGSAAAVVALNSFQTLFAQGFGLSALDSHTHLAAMAELADLLDKSDFYQILSSAHQASDIVNYIKQYEERSHSS